MKRICQVSCAGFWLVSWAALLFVFEHQTVYVLWAGFSLFILLWCYASKLDSGCLFSASRHAGWMAGEQTEMDQRIWLELSCWVEMCNVDSLLVSLLHPLSSGFDMQCVEPEGWYTTLVKVNTGRKKGEEVADNVCLQTKYASIFKSLNKLSV